MSILIKGMEMPKVSGVYSLDLYVEETCQVQNLDGAAFEAIEVPSHGRLIDADALMKKSMLLEFSGQRWVQKVDIVCAPTVIEAEEVYDKYTDTAGNLHWTGTHSGKHIVKI